MNGPPGDFDYDLGYGEQGEAIAQKWHAGGKETKRKRKSDDRFYLETHQRQYYKDDDAPWVISSSGIFGTKAPYYEFVIADTGIVVAFPTALLRRVVATYWPTHGKQTRHSVNPTYGVLVSLTEILHCLPPNGHTHG